MEHVEREGGQAFMAGVEMRRCPYRDIARRDAWLKGWIEARRVSRLPD